MANLEDAQINHLTSRQIFSSGAAEGVVKNLDDLLICGSVPYFNEGNIYEKFNIIIGNAVEVSSSGYSMIFTSESLSQRWLAKIENSDFDIEKLLSSISEIFQNFDINISDSNGKFDLCVDCLDRIMILRSTKDVYSRILEDFGGYDSYMKFIGPSLQAASFSEPIWKNQNGPYFSGVKLR